MAVPGSCVGVVNAGGMTTNNVSGRGLLPREAEELPRPPSCGSENTRSQCRRSGGEIGQWCGTHKCCPRATVSRYLLQRNSNIPNICLPGVEIDDGIMTELATSSLVGEVASFLNAREATQAMMKNECNGRTKKQKARQTVSLAQKRTDAPLLLSKY